MLLVPNKIDLLQDKEQLLPKIAEFSALLPLYPPGYLLPFTDQKGEQVNLSLRTSQTSVSNSSQEKWDFFVLSFNGAGV